MSPFCFSKYGNPGSLGLCELDQSLCIQRHNMHTVLKSGQCDSNSIVLGCLTLGLGQLIPIVVKSRGTQPFWAWHNVVGTATKDLLREAEEAIKWQVQLTLSHIGQFHIYSLHWFHSLLSPYFNFLFIIAIRSCCCVAPDFLFPFILLFFGWWYGICFCARNVLPAWVSSMPFWCLSKLGKIFLLHLQSFKLTFSPLRSRALELRRPLAI